MPEISLSPGGRLRWESDSPEGLPGLEKLGRTFSMDWREGFFFLSAHKQDVTEYPSLRYWQHMGDTYLTRLCHIPETDTVVEVAPPGEGEYARWILAAPPMRGGEYLSRGTLGKVWGALDDWVREATAACGALGDFLQKAAPGWSQVGRVCFHLAENKTGEDRPFAFMASYTTGFGASGKVKHQPLRQALAQYAGEKNKPALVRLLSPVHRAAERLPWVKALADSGGIYQPMVWPAERAYQFLRSVTELEDCGVSVRLPNWWRKRARPTVAVTIGSQQTAALGIKTMLDFQVQVALGDTTLTPEEIKSLIDGPDGLVMIKGQWIEVDREKLKEAIEHWETLREQLPRGEISFIEGMRLLAGASRDLKRQEAMDGAQAWAHVHAGEALRETLAALRDPGRLPPVDDDGALKATLRPYQREGAAWLRFLSGLGLGACLADDMGLGKTLQTLALLVSSGSADNGEKMPALLVVPASLMGNWRNEAQRFAPHLHLVFLHPSQTDREALDLMSRAPRERLAHVDLAVTTYSMVARQQWLADMPWSMVIIDEAQAIKNPATSQTKAIKKLQAPARIALTGTPVENRVGDLWSIFDFLNPGLLGSAKVFKDFVKTLQQRPNQPFAPLRQLVAPYILRRLKTDRSIIADLPDKTEVIAYCNLTTSQVKLYERNLQLLKKALGSTHDDGMARRGLVLQYLMRFKQICNHPSQLTGAGGYDPRESGKFMRIAAICEEIAARQEKVLVFTQFREIIDPLEAHLAGVFGKSGLVLHGGTQVQKRAKIVEQFQDEDGPPFFILSLKAGGSGLNLTAASHVIHFDRWWNPAVENQATDRAFRIGQKKNVLVHKFVTLGGIEEHIDALIREKQRLAAELLSDENEINLTELDDAALLELVRLDVTRAIA